MTDTITESFCERCGTRYSFDKTARPHRGGFGRVRVLTRGLRNYVANDGMPMAEAMAAARHDEERSGLTRQLDAFHKTFNFCMSCRQYTCSNCWNGAAGECLTCAPDLGREVLPPAFPDLPMGGPGEVAPLPDHDSIEATAWPRVDLVRAEPAGAGAPAAPAGAELPQAVPADVTPEPVAAEAELEVAVAEAAGAAEPAAAEAAGALASAAEPVAAEAEPLEVAVAEAAEEAPQPDDLTSDELAEVEHALAAAHPGALEQAAEVAPDLPLATPADRAGAARGQTRSLLRRFRPGKHAATEPEAARMAAAPATPPAPEPQPLPAVEPEGVAATPTMPEPEPEAAIPEPAPEPIQAAPAAAAPSAEPSAPQAPAPPRDVVAQPVWQIVAPDTEREAPASWPETSAWPSGPPAPPVVPGAAAAPWASRLATTRPEVTGVWAASSQEVLAAAAPSGAHGPGPTVQACVSCGLSLSATARFCRRCGSRQG